MAISQVDYEHVVSLALELPVVDKLKLMGRLTAALQSEIVPLQVITDNPMLMMVEAADRLGLSADRDDISEHFDDELRATWGKHLANKWNADDRPD
ncbi:MAG: hypothetical protein SGI73_23130 [Chloroflexota bacterium]|nr:hypothetical protein [Chloroflexota bacterium]